MMSKLFLTIFVTSTICSSAYSAELLVMAKDCADGSYSAGDIASTDDDGFYARSNGYKLPTFIVIKLPGIPKETIKRFEDPLNEEYEETRDVLVNKEKFESADFLREHPEITAVTVKEYQYGLTKEQVLDYGKTGGVIISTTEIAGDYVLVEKTEKRSRMKRIRKFNIPPAYLQTLLLAKKSTVTVNTTVISTFIQNMEEKLQ